MKALIVMPQSDSLTIREAKKGTYLMVKKKKIIFKITGHTVTAL